MAQIAAPPFTVVDQNNIDLTSGGMIVNDAPVTIGPSDKGLTFHRMWINDADSRSSRWSSNYEGFVSVFAGKAAVVIGNNTEQFTASGGNFVPVAAGGSTLVQAGDRYIYTMSDGTQAGFGIVPAGYSDAGQGYLTDITYPNGRRDDVHQQLLQFMLPSGPTLVNRIQSITNNFGYQIKLQYAYDSPGGDLALAIPAYLNIVGATAINNASEFCDPDANSCSLNQAWPYLAYSYYDPADNTAFSTVNTAGEKTTYYIEDGRLTGLKPPATGGRAINYGYSTDTGLLQNVYTTAGTWTYNFALSGATLTTTVTDPASRTRTLVTDTTVGRPSSETDALGRSTFFQYDDKKRLTRAIYPEGNALAYTYDDRGNITSVSQVGKPGSGVADIIETANYDASCTTLTTKTCNQPNWVQDARGGRTDYTYDPAHGGVLTVRRPAPSPGAVRPEMRFAYGSFQATYLTAPGTLGPGAPATLPTAVSQCKTASSCAGGGDEVKVTNAYGPTGGGASNLLLVSRSRGAGDGSLTATTAYAYDSLGNMTSTDGPLAGADVTRYRYDAARRVVGIISPDPDGAGPATPRAVKLEYRPGGDLVTRSDVGVVADQSDAAWANFSSAHFTATAYDDMGRKTAVTQGAGALNYTRIDYTYDPGGLVGCMAVRMSQATIDTPPTSACTLGVTGPNGPDRVTHYSYTLLNQVATVETAYGVASDQRTSMTATYTPNGKLSTVADGNGNLSTLEYDAYDRPAKTRFPSGAGVSSSTDYLGYTYDAGANVTALRLRDGNTITYTYDGLNRPSAKGGSARAVSYTYDNLDQLTDAVFTSGTSNAIHRDYDALGHLLSETTNGQTMSYQFDLAGNRTKVTWPGAPALSVDYGYNLTSDLTSVQETGGPVLATLAYDGLGRRSNMARQDGTNTTYGYDQISRLTSLSEDLAGAAYDNSQTFTYNPASEIITQTASNEAYGYAGPYTGQGPAEFNVLNQLIRDGGSLSYDGRGNLTNDGRYAYIYDAEDRLTNVNGPSSVTLDYDPLGRLLSLSSGSTSVRTALDDGQVVGLSPLATGSPSRRFVPGDTIDEPLVWYEGAASADRRYLHADSLGSITSASQGSALFVNKYDAFGSGDPSNQNDFGYNGQLKLGVNDLYYYKARIYAPRLGRFLQTDPIGYEGGPNLYAYVGDNPVNNVDPTGTCTGSHLANTDGTCIITGGWTTNIGDTGFEYNSKFYTPQQRQAAAAAGALGSPSASSNPSFNGSIDPVIVFGRRNFWGDFSIFDVWYNPNQIGFTCGSWDCTQEQALQNIRYRGAADYNSWMIIPVAAAVAGPAFVEDALAGWEIKFGKNFRIAPFGNRTGNSYGEMPHYHRRGLNGEGTTRPGQGIGRHRPWEKMNPDKSFWDRF